MIPLYDDEAPANRPPYGTCLIIIANCLIFLFTFYGPDFNAVTQNFGLLPASFLHGDWWAIATLITSLFLHDGPFHLIFNMWFLWIFGNNVESNLGTPRFIFFYLIGGVISGLAYALFSGPMQYVIGASGAISAVMGAYLVLFPKNKIRALWVLPPIFLSVPAIAFMVVYFVEQFIPIWFGGAGTIAYYSHAGGFIGGALLIILMKKRTEAKEIPAAVEMARL